MAGVTGARLFINPSDSRCGACGAPADPNEYGHFTRLGYRPGRGCGELWTSVSSDYTHSREWLLDTDQFTNLIGLPVFEVFEGLIGYYGTVFTGTSYNKEDLNVWS